MKNTYVVIGQVQEGDSGLLIGKPAEGGSTLSIETYNLSTPNENSSIVEIDERLFNGLAHFVLEELLHRQKKCLES